MSPGTSTPIELSDDVEDVHRDAVGEGTELLEPFGPFEGDLREGCEAEEGLPLEAVDADVAADQIGGRVALERDAGAGEVQRPSRQVDHDLDDVGVAEVLRRAGEGKGGHGHLGVVEQEAGEDPEVPGG